MLIGARVLVTGAYGFVGQAVIRELRRSGASPLAVRGPSREGESLHASVVSEEILADLAQPGVLNEVAKGCSHLIHLAAASGGIQFQGSSHDHVSRTNHTITRNVLDAARAGGIRRVFLASSGVVYSQRALNPIIEDAPVVAPSTDRVSGYAWSKVCDEVLAQWRGDERLEIIVGRFTNIYGPGGAFDPSRSTVVHSLIRKAVEAGPRGTLTVWGSGKAVRSFLHVDDCARAVLQLLAEGEPGTAYNVDSGEPVTISELARLVAQVVDPSLQLRFDESRPEGARERVLDTRRLRALNFEPQIELRAGLTDTLAAYRDLA